MEYKIELFLTPDTEDTGYPYFWVIMVYTPGLDWCNSGYCGWEKTTLEAFCKAITVYQERIKDGSSQNFRPMVDGTNTALSKQV